ncbi:hypothetical protein F5972_07765 [Microbispora cellulosiformans]|uniref:Uncharacterized protein n=1 Tax=Microbispora cellulosiformans TaxID=2614688 RepID=A0A5J5K881_9ACTN|nr:hypothetical protein [Microbispora cellulosiformans]KAA9380964.1 hypothetical protein F5972_07765 [Microbispora cellulosiformans]
MSPGDYGTKAVPSYIAAEAETTPLPKITVPPPAPATNSGKGLGDLPMRVVYRAVAVAAGVGILGAGAAFVVLGRGTPAPAEVRGPAAQGATQQVVLPSGLGSPAAVAGGAGTDTGNGGGIGTATEAVATPGLSPLSSASPLSASPLGAGPQASASPPGASPEPSPDTAMAAALHDPRVPTLPANERKLRRLHGHPARIRGLVKDRRSGVALPRFTKSWTLAKASPFASRQVLPKVKGMSYRGLLVSCPVPIPQQETLRDTAFLAARWTLNHHPSGATITWTASQPMKAGKRKGWLLGYTVHYTVKGKKRTSAAALALVDVKDKKPAVVFVTIPDSQKKRWRDINAVMSSVKAL